MILIISSKTDAHIGPVTRHLDKAGRTWVRINTEDIARNMEMTIVPSSGRGQLYFHDSKRKVELNKVSAVWYRKPEPVAVAHFELDPCALEYVESEFRELLDNLYALLSHVPWINNPFLTKLAHRKMLQLCVARKVGFLTPPTLVTNNPDAAMRFAERFASDVAIKSLGAMSVSEGKMIYGLFTRRITSSELYRSKDKVCHLPTTFQQFVEKRSELRITCVGQKTFACRIETCPGTLCADDYRFDTKNLKHTACECPELQDRLQAYLREFSINFACFDFIVPSEGEPIFLEANCNGQWLWVENFTGLQIGEAIAKELLRESESAHGGGVLQVKAPVCPITRTNITSRSTT